MRLMKHVWIVVVAVLIAGAAFTLRAQKASDSPLLNSDDAALDSILGAGNASTSSAPAATATVTEPAVSATSSPAPVKTPAVPAAEPVATPSAEPAATTAAAAEPAPAPTLAVAPKPSEENDLDTTRRREEDSRCCDACRGSYGAACCSDPARCPAFRNS